MSVCERLKKFVKALGKYALKAYNIISEMGLKLMKRADLIKLMERNGWHFVRNGGNHDIYSNGKRIESIERHKEIPE